MQPPLTDGKLARKRARAALVMLGVGFIALAGCGGGGGSGSGSSIIQLPPVTNPPVTTPPAALSVSAKAADGLTASLAENAATTTVGGTITYTFALMNGTAAPITVLTTLAGTVNEPIASLVLANSAGVTVYPVQHPLTTPPGPPGTATVTLQPGQAVTRTLALAAFGASGTYGAVASFSVAASAQAAPQAVTLPALSVTVQ